MLVPPSAAIVPAGQPCTIVPWEGICRLPKASLQPQDSKRKGSPEILQSQSKAVLKATFLIRRKVMFVTGD